jgi:hypothetical protein
VPRVGISPHRDLHKPLIEADEAVSTPTKVGLVLLRGYLVVAAAIAIAMVIVGLVFLLKL